MSTPAPTPISLQITTLDNCVVTNGDQTTVSGKLVDLILNKNVTASMAHTAATAYDSIRDAAVTAAQTATATANAAAQSAQTATAALQQEVDLLVQQGESATDFPSLQAVLVKAATLSTPARQAAIAALIAKHQTELANLQAKQAALATPSN